MVLQQVQSFVVQLHGTAASTEGLSSSMIFTEDPTDTDSTVHTAAKMQRMRATTIAVFIVSDSRGLSRHIWKFPKVFR